MVKLDLQKCGLLQKCVTNYRYKFKKVNMHNHDIEVLT